jgi:trans-aconitate 2-methyltransferase
MVEHARRALGDRATVLQADLSELELPERVDAVFSNAVFHWVLDQQRLFDSLFRALKPGGVLVAQCAGRGNIARFLATVEEIAAQPTFARHMASFQRAWIFAGPEETEARLRTADFAEVRAWLSSSGVTAADPAGFLRAVPLRCHLELLPA